MGTLLILFLFLGLDKRASVVEGLKRRELLRESGGGIEWSPVWEDSHRREFSASCCWVLRMALTRKKRKKKEDKKEGESFGEGGSKVNKSFLGPHQFLPG